MQMVTVTPKKEEAFQEGAVGASFSTSELSRARSRAAVACRSLEVVTKTSFGWPGLDRREAPEQQSPGFRFTPTPATPFILAFTSAASKSLSGR